MNFKELAKARYSLRRFSDRPIEKEVLDQILEVSTLSPTAVNFQPQRILILQSKEALEKYAQCTPYNFHAPVVLVLCYDDTVSWKRSDYDGKDHGDIDVAIVSAHIMFEAVEHGLGTTWVGVFDPAKVKSLFNLPDNIHPVCLMPIGYPAEDAKPAHLHEKRNEISTMVTYESF